MIYIFTLTVFYPGYQIFNHFNIAQKQAKEEKILM